MSIRLLAVGTRIPSWVREGYIEYTKRFPKQWRFELLEVPADKRANGPVTARLKEAERLLNLLSSDDYVVALDEAGSHRTTIQLASDLPMWQTQGGRLNFVIGGADGLDQALLTRANQSLSLSSLTFPHALVRVVLAEQLYRAHTLNTGHPYHRN